MRNIKRSLSAEQRRLNAHARRDANWKHWGPYLAERAWGTVREDYSHDGRAWAFFPHDHARSRAYRWNEDGLGGFCDRNQYLCFSLAMWNGQDPFLKERLFGLSGPEGNHGEDVKELYWYLDSTPTHSFASMCYRYPQNAFPYEHLVHENGRRGYRDREFELSDTGIFADQKFFDISICYAKVSEDDILVSIDAHNRSEEHASLSLVPQLWFRNTWSWGYPAGPQGNLHAKPQMFSDGSNSLVADHPMLGRYHWYWQGHPELMMTDNETNEHRLYGIPNRSRWVKDAFHRYVVDGDQEAINPGQRGTKAGLLYPLQLDAGESKTIQLRLCSQASARPFSGFRPVLNRRRAQSDTFYRHLQSENLSAEQLEIQRQALSGMLWSKQLYYYDVRQWMNGDPDKPAHRENPRNVHWQHMDNFDVMSMPDKWEYPWYAVWDTAFHTLPLAVVDVAYAKRQLLLLTREWYMHPNGQLPAYEWAYGDVNPPVHAWATMRVYSMEKKLGGAADREFLEGVFQKLLLNFTWWVNQKDRQGNSIFEGGFLGLDNISLFDRSKEPPTGGLLNQSDGTAWMGFFAACMLRMALELARSNPVYQAIASKFFEHFLQIAYAINGSEKHAGLWDETDGFFYDRLDLPDGRSAPLKVRSLVGLLPLIATSILEDEVYHEFPDFVRRMNWLIQHRPELAATMANIQLTGEKNRHLLSFLDETRLRRVLGYLLDEAEFLSPHGIRSLSRFHAEHPYHYTTDTGHTLGVGYEPGEGETDLFGGNSNWRGPIWFPINYLLIESLRHYHEFHGPTFTVECPTGSGQMMTLEEVAQELSRRLITLFTVDENGHRPWCGENRDLQSSSDAGMHQFFEYFNGDTGEGLGASHQTGWTGLVALLMQPDLQCL
ncbi:MAG: glucosidase [Granulosicoccus sp.]|nr:glucosidase [Granulosicoccus sp.]